MAHVKSGILILLCLAALSCGNSKHATVERDLRIDFYSYGGIAGTASGVTLTGDGWVKKWTGRTASLRSVHDSVQVDSQQLARIDSLAASKELSALQSDQTGNLTTVLVVQREGKSHQVSFSGGEAPDSFPQSTRDLISELRKLESR